MDKVLLTDDGSERDIQPCLQDWIDDGFVEWVHEEGERHQMAAYARCIETHRRDYSWLAFVDLDEFIAVREYGSPLHAPPV